MNILGDNVHPNVYELFLDGNCIFQDDNAPIHTAHVVKKWYEEHECELERMEWPPQSIDLHIYRVFVARLGAPPLPSAVASRQLEQILMEEWPTNYLDEVRKKNDSIPRRIEAVEKAAR